VGREYQSKKEERHVTTGLSKLFDARRAGMRLRVALLLLPSLIGLSSAHAAAPEWKPEKFVELIVGTSPGSGVDLTARTMQGLLQTRKLVDVPVSVINKAGGGYNVAYAYLNQFPGDGARVFVTTSTVITGQITGSITHNFADFTPLAHLISEPIIFIVRPDSPLKTGKDMVDRLKADPNSLSIALAAARGNAFHLATAMIAKSANVDIRKLKIVVFNSSADGLTAALGGHVDVLAGTAGSTHALLQAGKIRVLGVAAKERLVGAFATVPTWKEQGINVVFDLWRGVLGAKGLTPAQVQYWDGVFERMTQSEDWHRDLEKNLWVNAYLNSEATRPAWKNEYDTLKALLVELGMVKSQ
jgi:putative tricarboxylic transport membrane protein